MDLRLYFRSPPGMRLDVPPLKCSPPWRSARGFDGGGGWNAPIEVRSLEPKTGRTVTTRPRHEENTSVDDRTAERGNVLLAALDNTPAVGGVLTTALGIAPMVGAEVEALHVTNGHETGRIAVGATEAAGIRLHKRTGPPAERILRDAPHLPGDGSSDRYSGVSRRPPTGGKHRPSNHRRHAQARGLRPSRRPPSRHLALYAPACSPGWSVAASRSFLALERHLCPDTDREVTVLLTLDGVMPPMLDRPRVTFPNGGARSWIATAPARGERSCGGAGIRAMR